MNGMELLEKKIKDSGLKKGYISDKLGIDRSAFRKKLDGKTEFTASEAGILVDLLKLTAEEVRLIFYTARLSDN